jgi:hypothetical protein
MELLIEIIKVAVSIVLIVAVFRALAKYYSG